MKSFFEDGPVAFPSPEMPRRGVALSNPIVKEGGYPRHFKPQGCVRSGLLDGLRSFRALEARIAGLGTKAERGEAFKGFAEAYLATIAVEKAKQVWPKANIPHPVRLRMGLTIGDRGVDGVFETQCGEYRVYQVKFCSGRPSLDWKEVSTLIGADCFAGRVLITNCDQFADAETEQGGFYAITGRDLDELEPGDFRAIRAWLTHGKMERSLKAPRPHQNEALANILRALREGKRATALMACGTGKTLAALWACEAMGVRNILVLVPSLALLRQTLHEWMRQTSWSSFAHLCVCSDPTVKPESDEMVLRRGDLDFPVSTDSGQVRAFLGANFEGVKLVLSTYQSARVVAAGMKRGQAFDLAIFDEAHKTAGRDGCSFAFALSDKHLRIKKRLFLTATPRHSEVRKCKEGRGGRRFVYSMDAPAVYGPVAHELSFAEAARRGIICGYKIIISVVSSDMVNEHLLRHGEVIVKGGAVRVRHVANQLALQAAVAKHGVRKIFTFHNSVASAATFTGDGPEGIDNHLGGFTSFHINGSMPTSERESVVNAFRDAPKGVMSNARCLTEGIDVPAVDMVAFLTPKRSRVDIVQAIGRAMRKVPGKKTGYVLVPLFVEQASGETIDEAIERTDYGEVWNVLRAMQEQDEMLASAIKTMGEQRGLRWGFDGGGLRDLVEFVGPPILLESLRDSITTTCVDVLGETWDERLGELKAFREQWGHCNVPKKWDENHALGQWVGSQRTLYNSGTLAKDRILRLNAIGFQWEPFAAAWEAGFDALKNYRKRYGHCDVAQRYKENPLLGRWVATQRAQYAAGKLEMERVRRLNEIGFHWGRFDALWEKRYLELNSYKKRFKHCDVPQGYKESPVLGDWVSTQRTLYRLGKLGKERIRRLDGIGFVWEQRDALWETNFAALKAYHKRFRSYNVPTQYKENPVLGHWVSTQRTRYRRGKLAVERVRRLNEIGFEWEVKRRPRFRN